MLPKAPTDTVVLDDLGAPIDPDPNSISVKGSIWYRQFCENPCVKFTRTVLIIIYALNIVAWGGMLFLILVGAANNTMPDEHTRKVWIEIDSQILNALFCVTGLGLIPWRIRDVCYAHKEKYRHKLFHHHPYTTNLLWIRIIVWTYIANSLFQIGMAVSMWSMDMYTRPSWLVGVFVGLGCVSGAFAGITPVILGYQSKKKSKEADRVLVFNSG